MVWEKKCNRALFIYFYLCVEHLKIDLALLIFGCGFGVRVKGSIMQILEMLLIVWWCIFNLISHLLHGGAFIYLFIYLFST